MIIIKRILIEDNSIFESLSLGDMIGINGTLGKINKKATSKKGRNFIYFELHTFENSETPEDYLSQWDKQRKLCRSVVI